MKNHLLLIHQGNHLLLNLLAKPRHHLNGQRLVFYLFSNSTIFNSLKYLPSFSFTK